VNCAGYRQHQGNPLRLSPSFHFQESAQWVRLIVVQSLDQTFFIGISGYMYGGIKYSDVRTTVLPGNTYNNLERDYYIMHKRLPSPVQDNLKWQGV
jgi:hypothetical protein